MKILKIFLIIVLSSGLFLINNSCQTIQQVSNALANMQRLQFKLDNVNNFSLAGIGLSNKNSVKDFSLTDGFKLTSAFASKSFPAEFVLNVAALNPNDGKGGTPGTSATLTSLDWQLYIDDVPTISGNIASPVEIPGTGQTTLIPLKMNLDLYKFFQNKGYDGIINIALALGGVKSSPAKLKLDARPTVNTPFGPIVYPGRITIIDKQYSN